MKEKKVAEEKKVDEVGTPFFLVKSPNGGMRVVYDVDVLINDIFVMIQNSKIDGERADSAQVLFDLIAGLSEARKLKYSYEEKGEAGK